MRAWHNTAHFYQLPAFHDEGQNGFGRTASYDPQDRIYYASRVAFELFSKQYTLPAIIL